ncbi:MAG: sugar isomerase domain-containing protein [Actinobacteria bacterium]|nr:sugar isomerase domain-containing protein [Actinomycetota bacterium]
MNASQRYIASVRELLDGLAADESSALELASGWCAQAIGDGNVVHVFGAGHSRMPVEEAYPRIGAVVGFRPVVELAVTYFHEVVGPNGLDQAIFLERVSGYGRVIFDNLRARDGDVVLVFSSSGLEHIILDLVEAARERGLRVIGVTSVDYSTAAAEQRGGTTRLAEIADLVIDNHVPVGDALVELEGLGERVGASASVLNIAVMNAITAGTTEQLLEHGVEPYVFASPHLVGEEEGARRYRECLDAYERHVQRRRPVAADGEEAVR